MIGFYLKYNNELKWAKVCIFLFPFPANVSLYFKISQFPKSVAGNAQKMEFFIEDFFSKYDQIRRKLRIQSNLLKESLMENFIFCAMWKKTEGNTGKNGTHQSEIH